MAGLNKIIFLHMQIKEMIISNSLHYYMLAIVNILSKSR